MRLTCHRVGAAATGIVPHAQQVNKEVAAKLDREHLGDHVEVGNQSRLQDDGDVAGVEQLDGVGTVLASIAGRLDWQVHTEALNG